MGVSRTEIFSNRDNKIAAFAKAFAHPARVAIIGHLIKTEGCICGELVEEIGLSQPTISQHLKELKTMGLIQGEVNGTRICYCIHRENWAKMREILSGFLSISFPKDCC